MKTIICITTKPIWQKAVESGEYKNSTIHSSLKEVGFIHGTTPDQTMGIIPRFSTERNVILLFVDIDKVNSPIKFEPASSGRPGLFPHIYGPLNVAAVYKIVDVKKDYEGKFIAPKELVDLENLSN